MKRAILTQEDAIFSRQKRWMSEEAIIAAIDRERAIQRTYCAEAERCAALARSHQQAENITDYEFYKNESEKMFGKADRKEERIKELGQKLAAFRTELLSFTNDRAVV